MRLLPRNLASLSKLVRKDEDSRFPAMTALRVAELPDNRYRVDATDGRRAVIVEGEGDLPEQFPTMPGLQDAPNSATVAMVRREDYDRAFKSIPKRTDFKPVLGNVAAVLGANEATFGATDLDRREVFQARQVEGRYPNVDDAVPPGEPLVSVNVDAKLLAELLTVAANFTAEDSVRVTLELRRNKYDASTFAPIVLRVSNPQQKFTGILVPLDGGSINLPRVQADADDAAPEPLPVAPVKPTRARKAALAAHVPAAPAPVQAEPVTVPDVPAPVAVAADAAPACGHHSQRLNAAGAWECRSCGQTV